MSIVYTSAMVGPTLHLIGDLVAPRPILMLCEFSPLFPLLSFFYMSYYYIEDNACFKHKGELAHVWGDYDGAIGHEVVALSYHWGHLMRQ